MDDMSPSESNELVYRDSVFRRVQHVRTIVTRLDSFDGSDPILLLSFLSFIRSAFNPLKLRKEAAFRSLAGF